MILIVWKNYSKIKFFKDKKLRERRIEFYKNLGAEFLSRRFIQPPIDGLNCPAMRLMYYLLNSQISIQDHEQAIIHAIYFKKYQVVNKISTEVIQNLLKQVNE